jgi:hypothetical protein
MAACDSRVYPLCTREDRHRSIPPFDNGMQVQRVIRLRAKSGGYLSCDHLVAQEDPGSGVDGMTRTAR